MSHTTTSRQARTDEAYAVSKALIEVGTRIGDDLLPRPLSVTPPAHGRLTEVHVIAAHVAAWRFSMVDPSPVERVADHVTRSCTGRLDLTDTSIRLVWIEQTS